ncbi:MAG: alcohol dehydrogenase catalytic domain-containing protein [Hyphomonadaceae bacterium]
MRCEAVTAFGAPLESLERDLPVPGPGEAVVKISRAGVCHSDVHLHDGYFDMGGGQKLAASVPLPAVLGHEIEGKVAALGPDVSGPPVGAQVAVYPWIGCGKCATCARGDQHMCSRNRNLGLALWGGFADHVLVPDARALIPADGLAPGVAALAMCSGLTAYSALNKIGKVDPADPIVILGFGGLGVMGLALANALLANPVTVMDIDPAKREAALARGAAEAVDPADAAAVKAFSKRTGGAAAALDFVGAPATFAVGTQVIRRGGALVLVGLFGGAAQLSLATIPMRPISIIGSLTGSLAEAEALIALLKTGKVAPPVMENRPMSAANQALNDLRAGRVLGRVVLTP